MNASTAQLKERDACTRLATRLEDRARVVGTLQQVSHDLQAARQSLSEVENSGHPPATLDRAKRSLGKVLSVVYLEERMNLLHGVTVEGARRAIDGG